MNRDQHPDRPASRIRARTAARTAGASLSGLIGGAVPIGIFWYLMRGADGGYPPNSEALVLVAAPLLAGAAFASVSARRVWRRSVWFSAVFAILPALLTMLVIYEDEDGLGADALAVLAAWALCWFMGALGAGLVSRMRTSIDRGGTPKTWLQGWWRRRRCPHNWELTDTRQVMGRVGHLRFAGDVGSHNLYYYRCSNCGAIKHKSDRWGPIADRRQ